MVGAACKTDIFVGQICFCEIGFEFNNKLIFISRLIKDKKKIDAIAVCTCKYSKVMLHSN